MKFYSKNTEETRTVEIIQDDLNVDVTADILEVGHMEYDEETDTYITDYMTFDVNAWDIDLDGLTVYIDDERIK